MTPTTSIADKIVRHIDWNLEFYVLSLIAAAIIATPFLLNWHGKYQCDSYEELAGIETQYNNWDSCYIKIEGRFYRWDEYKAIQREVKIK